MSNKTTIAGGLNWNITKNPNAEDYNQYEALKGTSVQVNERDEISLNGTYGEVYDTNRNTSIMNKAPASLFNRYALFTYMGLHGEPIQNISQYYKESLVNDIMNPEYAQKPTVRRIVDHFSDRGGGIEYNYTDFVYCKLFRQVPNNYMITLRRFANPVEDNIYNNQKLILQVDSNNNSTGNAEPADMTFPDMARAVTYMSEASNNKMEDILSFAYGYNWKEHEADTTTHENNSEGYTGHPFYQKLNVFGQSFFDVVRNVSSGEKQRRLHHSGHDPLTETYENFVIGPVNVINKMTTRDRGLNFDQEIKLTFKYELKEISGINPRAAMLDLFANWMVLTFSNANFWGGANRFYNGGGFVASRFGDDNLLKNGDWTGYIRSVVSDMGNGFNQAFGQQNADGGFTFTKDSVVGGLKQAAGTLLGNMLGGFIHKMMGAPPAYIATKGLITGEATGNWHLTIGNPMNPIAMIGNLVVKDTNVTFGGGLGADDFPNEMTCEVTLAHARPRDKTDIESMFNAGKGRLYSGADKFSDILNLEGADVEVYGAFQYDSTGKSKTGTGGNHGAGSHRNADDLERFEDIYKDGKSATIKGARKFGKWAKDNSEKYITDHVDALIHT